MTPADKARLCFDQATKLAIFRLLPYLIVKGARQSFDISDHKEHYILRVTFVLHLLKIEE